MGTGPQAKHGFDLSLTELLDANRHVFLVHVGSERGAELLSELEAAPATEEHLRQAETAVETAARQQVRNIDNTGIKELLYQNFEHPRWDNVAARCLTCANCTMVCPTCFCTTVEDVSDVSRRACRAMAPLGFMFHAEFLLYSRRQRAGFRQVTIPPVDDTQAGLLDRSVRNFRVRGLRALYHLVPGGN